MATGGSTDSRGPPDHLSMEPHALPPRHHGFNNSVYYSDAPATTPSGTTTQRDLHQQLRRTPRAPDPSHPQRQELNTVFTNDTVRADTKDTPEGSTETLVAHYTAGRVLSTATPPHRVVLFSAFAFFDQAPTTPTPPSTPSSAPDTEHNYPTPWMQPRRTTTGGRGAATRSPRATPAGPACPRAPPPRR